MFDTDEDDGNYEDFMVSDDESLQMEFESDTEDHGAQQQQEEEEEEMARHDSATSNRDDTIVITKLVSEGEELMNAGRWNDARLQFTKILNIIHPNTSVSPSLAVFPIWVKIMTCWSRILYYNNCNALLDLNDLFVQCNQFCSYFLQEDNSINRTHLHQLQCLIIDFFPDLSNRYIFEINEIDDCERGQILDKISLQSNLYTVLKDLGNVDHQINDFLELQSIIISQWKGLLSTSTKPPLTNDAHSPLPIGYDDFLETINNSLINMFEKGDCSTVVDNKNPFEQRTIIKRFELIFQISILSYLFNDQGIISDDDTLLEIQLNQTLELFQQYSRGLLTISQDSKIMLLYHFSYCIQLITSIPTSMNLQETVALCRDHFLSSLQHLEIVGSYNQWTQNGCCQYILSGFILTSIFIILQDRYDNNSQLHEDRLLDPFEYEQIKILGKNLQYRDIIRRLQQFYTQILEMTNLQDTYHEVEETLKKLNIHKAVDKYGRILDEMFNIVIKLKLLTQIVPLYERISIIDLQKLLTYDPINHQLTRDDIIKLLMEFKLHDEVEPGRRTISFSIDFVEDHVLFDEGLLYTREVFADNDIMDTFEKKNQAIEIFLENNNNNNNSVKEGNGKDGDTVPHTLYADFSDKAPKVGDLTQFQLQAALLISESLSTAVSSSSSV